MKSFEEGTRALEQVVGHGRLTGSVVVDQIYALPIESGYWRTGPLAGVTNQPRHGGETHALANALEAIAEPSLRHVGQNIFRSDALGGFGVQAMAEAMEHLSAEYHERAPREFEDLRNSGHPIVHDDGRLAYDRPPMRPRLSDAALAEKNRRRALGEGISRRRDSGTVPFAE